MENTILVQDDDCHWYRLPRELEEDFYMDLQDEDFADSGRFDEKYGKYMTGGGPNRK